MAKINIGDEDAFELMQLADSGDSEAQYHFARYLLYDEELNVREDLTQEAIERAMYYLQQSATQGDMQGAAAMELGDIYYLGGIVPIDYTKAILWYRTAVLKGNPPAAYNLGECAYYGKGMPIDKEEAIEWYLKAIKGYVMTLIRFGNIYRAGDYFAADQALAYKLFRAVFCNEVRVFEKYHLKTYEYELAEALIAEMEKTGEQNTPPPPEEAIGELDAKVRARLEPYVPVSP